MLICLCEKLLCILSILFSMVFHVDAFLLAMYDQQMGIYEFHIGFAM